MQLLVVYGLKTTDYSWLDQFYPAQRISQECANRSIPLRFLFPADVPSYIDEIETTDHRSGEMRAIVRDTVCLIRGSVSVATVRLLENEEFACVNTASAMALANDKLATARFLERHRWPTCETIRERDFRIDTIPFPWPLVRKPRFGSRGTGVSLVSSPEELAQLRSTMRQASNGTETANDEYILQRYIETSRGRDLRVFFAAGEILAIAERNADGDNLLSNASSGAVMRIPEVPLSERWAAMALAIARASGLWYGSVDFLYLAAEEEGNGQNLTVCEINSAPGFEALEKECGYNIAGMLIDRLFPAEKSLLAEQ